MKESIKGGVRVINHPGELGDEGKPVEVAGQKNISQLLTEILAAISHGNSLLEEFLSQGK